MAHILSISYDPVLLKTRELLLVSMGHQVTSVEGFAQTVQTCERGEASFDLVVMGHSIPHLDKQAMVRECQKTCCCPVLALLRSNEPPLEEAARCVDPGDPGALVKAIQELLAEKSR